MVSQLVGDDEDGMWTRTSQVSVLILAGVLGLVGGAFMLRRKENTSV